MNERVPTSIPHRAFALIGTSFICFEIYFLIFYANNFWFTWPITWLGIPVMLLAIATAHLLLLLLQSKAGCKSFRWIWKGCPPVVYTRWITYSDDGFWFGLRHVRFSVIDELALTFFGNLHVRTRAIGGPELDEADLIFKLPFSAGTQAAQNDLVERVKKARPDVVLNKVLLKALNNVVLKGQVFVQGFGAAIMILVLIDLGQSSFYYMALHAQYHLARVAIVEGRKADGEEYLRLGDQMFDHPLPLSYLIPKFFNSGANAGGTHELKADVLRRLGRIDEAMAELKKAQEANPEAFRAYLAMARLQSDQGKIADALENVKTASEKHKLSMLTGLYKIGIVRDGKPDDTLKAYEEVSDVFNEEAFGEEPRWPPTGRSYLHDVFYSDDIYFILDKLLGKKEPTAPKLHYPEKPEKADEDKRSK